MSRRCLAVAVGLFASVLALGFGIVLLATGKPSRAVASESAVFDISSLGEGELLEVEALGSPLFVLRPSAAQWESIRSLDAHVWDRDSKAWFPEVGVFIYWGIGQRGGRECALRHVAPGQSVLVKYWNEGHWLGGYSDYICETGYDYAGRAIASREYSFNGWDAKAPNLSPPASVGFHKGKVVVARSGS